MQFSDWQHERLRNALSAYHDYGDGKRPFNWKGVVEGIVETLGADVLGLSDDPAILKAEDRNKRLKLHAERLRQFVEGYTAPDGVRKYPEPQPALLDAIVKFATHKSNPLLSPDELREFQPDWQAALRLLEYLDHKLDAERLLPPAYLEGTYEGQRRTDEALVVSELTLQRASKQGIIQAVQIDELYQPSIHSVTGLSAQERAKARLDKPHKKYGGWAILTPEDTLVLFMKEARYHRNHYYFTLASDLDRATEQPVTRLTCLYHDYGLEPGDGAWDANMLPSAMVILMENNIVYFNRIESHADA